jgi:hypothetical protein
MKRRSLWFAAGVVVLAALAVFYRHGRAVWGPFYSKIRGRRSVTEVLDQYGPPARQRLEAAFYDAGARYPPGEVALLAFKTEKRLELWARRGAGWKFIRSYPILAASGHVGPKLREGDRQVPEGVYRIAALNPDSAYHLSLKLNYPNRHDRRRAQEDGRSDPGRNIFIHGSNRSIGCIAVGNEAIEELFVLAATVGRTAVQVIIAPADIRSGRSAPQRDDSPPWTAELYDTLRTALAPFGVSDEPAAEGRAAGP